MVKYAQTRNKTYEKHRNQNKIKSIKSWTLDMTDKACEDEIVQNQV